MKPDNQPPSLSDASKPNAGRIYDYLLGGSHNFGIDRATAEQLIKQVPFLPKLAKLTRWFLGKSIREAVKRGFTGFLDFASGLPTVDHIHSTAPEGTKVVYSDIDPITVQYAKKIIGENPIVKYELCDAAVPETLLESDVVKTMFGEDHKVAIGLNGICWFLKDEQISHAMKVLYEWVDEGALLFLTSGDFENMVDEFQAFINVYKSMNEYIAERSKKTFIELIKPWEIEEPGFLSLEEWIGMTPTVTEETIRVYGGGGLFGGFLKK